MKKSNALKVVNPILALLIASQALTGLLNDALPEEFFEIVHESGGIALCMGVLLHIWLNWGWVKSNFFKKSIMRQR